MNKHIRSLCHTTCKYTGHSTAWHLQWKKSMPWICLHNFACSYAWSKREVESASWFDFSFDRRYRIFRSNGLIAAFVFGSDESGWIFQNRS